MNNSINDFVATAAQFLNIDLGFSFKGYLNLIITHDLVPQYFEFIKEYTYKQHIMDLIANLRLRRFPALYSRIKATLFTLSENKKVSIDAVIRAMEKRYFYICQEDLMYLINMQYYSEQESHLVQLAFDKIKENRETSKELEAGRSGGVHDGGAHDITLAIGDQSTYLRPGVLDGSRMFAFGNEYSPDADLVYNDVIEEQELRQTNVPYSMKLLVKEFKAKA